MFRVAHDIKSRLNNASGFTLIELMIVIAIIGTLAAIAIPNYISYRNKAVIVSAVSDLKNIEKIVIIFAAENDRFPDTLLEAGRGVPIDPWGSPYVYYPMSNVPHGVRVRKDRSLHPLNTDFDLYSAGPDRKSVAALTADISFDDIIRANNGGYLGVAKYY